ncbi:MAG TPA: hypothetical protein VIQ80_01710, partial [Candidatus Saccharimonadales bacterium]
RRLPSHFPFPTAREILHFEGLNGPDGIKRKSPAKDEPWHYIDPANLDDRAIVGMISDHIFNMAEALKHQNRERAAFEAAWMAHAIVDGLTPAHHYPLEAKLEELRGGEGLETRRTTKDKLLLPGNTRRMQLRNNWEYWGARGVMTTHLNFELGIATTIAPLRFDEVSPTDEEYARMESEPFENYFLEVLERVNDMKMYEEFTKVGWTRELAKDTRLELVPTIIKAVMLAWYQAVVRSRQA